MTRFPPRFSVAAGKTTGVTPHPVSSKVCAIWKERRPGGTPGLSGSISGQSLELEVDAGADDAELGLVRVAGTSTAHDDGIAGAPVEADEIGAAAVVVVIEVHVETFDLEGHGART